MTTNKALIAELASIQTDDCVNWPRGTDSSGYGKVYVDGIFIGGHRLALSLSGIEVHSEDKVLHKCDNPKCVNPAHLFVGTQADNVRDMVAKGRNVNLRGDAHGMALTGSGTVREIKRDLRDGMSVGDVAKKHGLPYTRVWMIATGKNWSHI